MLLMLTWTAGSVDAISYLGLGHVFTAMMTGNTVLLGLALGQGEILAAFRSILALGGFLAGAAVGAMIVGRDEKQGAWPPTVTGALALEGAVLGIFTATWYLTGTARSAGVVDVLIVLSGLAMGIQATAVRHLSVPGIATTYITGTLTSLAVDLVGWLRSPAVPSSVTPSAGKTTQPAGETRRGPTAARRNLRLVHRGVRYEGPERGQGVARRALVNIARAGYAECYTATATYCIDLISR